MFPFHMYVHTYLRILVCTYAHDYVHVSLSLSICIHASTYVLGLNNSKILALSR